MHGDSSEDLLRGQGPASLDQSAQLRGSRSNKGKAGVPIREGQGRFAFCKGRESIQLLSGPARRSWWQHRRNKLGVNPLFEMNQIPDPQEMANVEQQQKQHITAQTHFQVLGIRITHQPSIRAISAAVQVHMQDLTSRNL